MELPLKEGPLLAIISSKENIANLDAIQQEHLKALNNQGDQKKELFG